MANNPITAAELKETLIEVLPAALSKGSVLTTLGAPTFAKIGDKLVWYGIGGPSAVDENGVKPLSDISVNEKDIYRTTLTQIIVATNQSQKRDEGVTKLDQLVAQAIDSLAPGGDVVILSGTSPSTGAAIADLALVNVINNSRQHVYNAATDGDFDLAVIEAMKNNAKGRSMALSDEGFAELAFIENQFGPKYPQSTLEGTFPFRWLTAAVASQVGEKGWTASASIPNDVLAVVGDTTQIVRAIESVEVKFSTEATVGGTSLWETNKQAYLIEVGIAWAVKDLTKLTTIKKFVA